MNLLIISNNPNRASFRQRMEIYLETLRRDGIHCEIAKLPSSEPARLGLFRRAAAFDGVFVHKKCLNIFDAGWLRRHSKKIIYDFDDAVMYSPQTPDSRRSSHFRLFRRTAQLADMIIAGNSYLAEHAKRFNPNVKVLPTGLNIGDYALDSPVKKDGRICLVWIGSHSTIKYLAEIRPALEEIGSAFANVVLRIICDGFFDLRNMEVEKCRWSLESQARDLARGDIGLSPLPDNRFTRGKCGFKALQYGAAGLPTVVSPVGVNAEYVIDGVTGCHASEIQQWVEKVGKLVGDVDLRKQMAQAARRQVERFDSDIIGSKLSGLITECIKEASSKTEEVKVSDVRAVGALAEGKPKVSICIPTYNRKKLLKETIDSVLAQTYKDYEIVIVDDGSTDGTENMIRQLGFGVRYCWQENSGDAAARNKLVELARGKYISFIDSDDLLLSDAIERMVRVLEAQAEDVIVYGSYLRIDQSGNIYGRCKRKLYSGNITKYLFQTILVHSCGSMFPSKILKNSVGFDTSCKLCSDYDLWLRLSLKYRFIALPEPTFKRRRHLDNLSSPSFENCLTELQVLERFYYEKGGNKIIPEKMAMKVFSKEERRTGRCAITEGLYDEACELLGQSFRQYPNLKSLAHWTRAVIAKRVASS